jgi:pimeloyl-ACP methyl ester carboxylesterase
MIIQEKNINIDNLFINYRTIGNGPVFLLLHGWGHDSSHWERVAKIIAENGFKVIAPDLPGFGKSQTLNNPWTLENYKDFVLRFCQETEIKETILFGHSFGGRISILLASEKNDLIISKLILCASAGLYTKQSPKFILINSISEFFANILEKIGLSELKDRLKNIYIQLMNTDYQKANTIMRQTLLNIGKETLFHRVSHINTKTKIIWGKVDGITPLKSADYLKQNIKDSTLAVLEKGNHSPHIYMPEVLAKEIITFIK